MAVCYFVAPMKKNVGSILFLFVSDSTKTCEQRRGGELALRGHTNNPEAAEVHASVLGKLRLVPSTVSFVVPQHELFITRCADSGVKV